MYYCQQCGQLLSDLPNTGHQCTFVPNQWSLSCEHCYCKPAYGYGGTNPHRQCCKCGCVMAEEFIAKDQK